MIPGKFPGIINSASIPFLLPSPSRSVSQPLPLWLLPLLLKFPPRRLTTHLQVLYCCKCPWTSVVAYHRASRLLVFQPNLLKKTLHDKHTTKQKIYPLPMRKVVIKTLRRPARHTRLKYWSAARHNFGHVQSIVTTSKRQMREINRCIDLNVICVYIPFLLNDICFYYHDTWVYNLTCSI